MNEANNRVPSDLPGQVWLCVTVMNQVRVCLGKYNHICSFFAYHRVLDYGSDLKEIMLAKCS